MRIRLLAIWLMLSSSAALGQTGGAFAPTWATLFETDDSCTTTITSGASGTFVGWITASVSSSSGMSIDLSDSTGDSVTIPISGDYSLSLSGSYFGTNNADMIVGLTVNGVISNFRTTQTNSTGVYIDSVSIAEAVGSFTAGQKVRLGIDSGGTDDVLNVCHFSFTVRRVR